MKRLILFALLLSICRLASGQDVYSRFYDALEGKDSAALEETIREIRATGGQSAERYIAEYNYYVNTSLAYSGMVTTTEYPDSNVQVMGNVFTLQDSTGNPAGYMYFANNWDSARVDSALRVISRGIALYPDRLDMRYGKIHYLRQLGRWQPFADEIHATIDRSAQTGGHWIFPDNDESPDSILIYGVLDYQRSLFEALQDETDSLAKLSHIMLLRGIAEHMLQRYPKDIFNMNIMAISYQVLEDHKNALKWFKKAEKNNPKDIIVLSNLADTYHILGKTRKERKYLKKIIKYGDAEAIWHAQNNLKELNNNK